ncbi:response regulator transcription factor [Chengkuizengella axinellae]|uniref:Response regulator transcription factor n=1 Tax=Chengkuizengella axinellae TaxID=3064388 RepID=A0ABT9IWS1_9BACL|nr:response regulator transcription factor [Chengkuizengella sp. 2205SS18-9]MDP5273703.1 response regulator transcription factor [Chengkuizengella sp. 2205SS18-9]
MEYTILVADDETNITDVCSRYLEREGYHVITVNDGEVALEMWKKESLDLIILDLMMPGKTGWQVCEEIRNKDDIPIIMLTARAEEMDRVMGLTMGADDYLTKPFSPRELVLRVKGILRRQQRVVAQPFSEPDIIKFSGLEIDVKKRSVTVNGKPIELTYKEFEVLLLLSSHPNQVFSRDQLLNKVWNSDYEGDMNTVTVHVRRLREKIEPDASKPKYIKTVWGIGYKIEGSNES